MVQRSRWKSRPLSLVGNGAGAVTHPIDRTGRFLVKKGIHIASFRCLSEERLSFVFCRDPATLRVGPPGSESNSTGASSFFEPTREQSKPCRGRRSLVHHSTETALWVYKGLHRIMRGQSSALTPVIIHPSWAFASPTRCVPNLKLPCSKSLSAPTGHLSFLFPLIPPSAPTLSTSLARESISRIHLLVKYTISPAPSHDATVHYTDCPR